MTGRHKMQREAMGSKVKLDNKALAGLAVCRRNRRRETLGTAGDGLAARRVKPLPAAWRLI